MPDDLGISVLKSACTSEAKDLALEWTEIGFDALLEEGFLKDAPILGSIVKLCALSKTIRDRLFLRKVYGFLRACPTFTEAEKRAFADEHLRDPKRSRRLGDAIVLLIDRLDDLEKPAMLAKMFAALVRKHIDYASFRRLAAGIERAFVDDLISIVTKPWPAEAIPEEFLALLEPSGFVFTGGGVTRGGAFGTRTDISPLGRLFQKCMSEE
jgi:hypothetical protein